MSVDGLWKNVKTLKGKRGFLSNPKKDKEASKFITSNPEEILNLLQNNARLSVEDIAAMTKKEPAEVEQIIHKLEQDGVILKYAAIVNPEKVVITLDKHANTSAASIPLALNEVSLDSCKNVVLLSMGAGFTWGEALLKL